MTVKINNSTSPARLGRRRNGVALIEFAFVVPILIAMLLGIIEFGWFVKNQLQVANAVRDGARDAAVGLTTDQIRQRVINRASGVPGMPDNMTLEMKWDAGTGSSYAYNDTLGNNDAGTFNNAPTGSLIQVKATVTSQSLTGFPFLLNKNWSATVIMRRESNG